MHMDTCVKKTAVLCHAHRCMALKKVLFPPKWIGQPTGQGFFWLIEMICQHASGFSVLRQWAALQP